MKIKVAVIFGGKSVEHEISVISALQACEYINREKYEVIPLYMTKDGKFYVGDEIGKIEAYKDVNALLKNSTRVILLDEDGKVKVTRYTMKQFGNNTINAIDVAFP